jgi:two-component system response regulator RegA
VKLGAADYLTKPADGDDLTAALLGQPTSGGTAPKPMTAHRARWEHIHRVLEFSGHNISEASRRLGLHRRTLQRILAKRAPR